VGSRWLAPLGLAIVCLSLVLLGQLDAASSDWDLIWRLLVAGLGQGLFFVPSARAIMTAAPQAEQGVASGTLATARVIGQGVSVALAGAVSSSFVGTAAVATLAGQQQMLAPAQLAELQTTFASALHAAFVVCAAIAALGVLTALVRGQERSATSPALTSSDRRAHIYDDVS
jgi:sugar phosphate permease